MDWKIYYGNGKTFSSEDGKPHEAPPHNVVAIAQKNESTGRDVFHGWDWYIYHDDFGWWGCDLHGMIDQVMHNIEKIHGVLQGRSVRNETYQAIIKKAREGEGLPHKAADRRGECPAQRWGPGSK